MRRVVLDIDGVLLRGSAVLPGAQKALKKLVKHEIPHCFVTNGGGTTEAKKASDLTKKLGVVVRPEQVILSHTPFRDLPKDIKEGGRVLILGNESSCKEVARSYGFKHPVSANDLFLERPTVYPVRKSSKSTSAAVAEREVVAGLPVNAALIFHDPLDWGLEAQLLVDVLLGDFSTSTTSHGSKGNDDQKNENAMKQVVPLYASNADLVYKTEHSTPRLTQGAFVEAFRAIFEQYTQKFSSEPLYIHFCGKPFQIQYRLAEAVLEEEYRRIILLKSKSIKGEGGAGGKESGSVRYFGIGDNPVSDIRGANNAKEINPNWTSILVRTGVWNGKRGENDVDDPADAVLNDIEEAVEYVLST